MKRLVPVNKRLLKFFENTMNVTTVLEEKWFCLIRQLKSWSLRGASHHLAFMGNCPTISHTFLALFTQWVSSPPSRKWRRGVCPRFYLIVLCLVKVKRIEKGEFRILMCNPSGGNLVFMPKYRSNCPAVSHMF